MDLGKITPEMLSQLLDLTDIGKFRSPDKLARSRAMDWRRRAEQLPTRGEEYETMTLPYHMSPEEQEEWQKRFGEMPRGENLDPFVRSMPSSPRDPGFSRSGAPTTTDPGFARQGLPELEMLLDLMRRR